jgi:nitrate reductase gamma subunit
MELTNYITNQAFTDFIRGPLVWITFIVFFMGIFIQIFRYVSLTRVKEHVVYNPRPRKKNEPEAGGAARMISGLKQTVVGANPVMILVTTVFHVCLVVIPVFLLGHNLMLKSSWGISFFSFSEKVSDILTLVFLACCLFFLLRRLFLPRVRIITTFYDYVMLFLATAPFLTGYLAYHHIGNYAVMINLHILFGELMLLAVPFTKFVHMFFFFVFRFLIESEYALGKGNRTW